MESGYEISGRYASTGNVSSSLALAVSNVK